MNKKVLIILTILLSIFGILFVVLWFLSGGILGEMLFDRPQKPKIKHGEIPFELVYEYNNKQFVINETFVFDYDGISFSLDGGNRTKWNCYITNNDDYGRYYLDKEKYPSLHIQVPIDVNYYIKNEDEHMEFIEPYIYFVDDSSGTTYYEKDLTNVVGAKIISWKMEKLIQK